MTLKRLWIWILEKLVELHLAVVVVLLVTTLLPSGAENYSSLQAFTQAVRDNAHTAIDDATYMTRTFMGGNTGLYVWKTYLATIYIIGFYIYLASLYLFASLLACLFDHRHYALSAVLAFCFSAVVFGLRFVPIFDAATLRTGAVLFVLGLGIVFVSAVMGEWLTGAKTTGTAPKKKTSKKTGKPSVTRRVSFDLGE